jgi:hypothetical protein
MSRMKNLGRILILLILMVMPMQAYASSVPIMVPIPIRMGKSDLNTSKDRIEQYRGLSKLTDNLLNLEITKADYKELITHFKDKRNWTEKTIEVTMLKNLKANDFILVHDANVNEVYEMPIEEIQKFIKEKYKDVDLEKDYDAITFMTGEKTVEKKLKPVKFKYGKTKFTMDLTAEQLAQVKEILQLNANKKELMGLVNISVTIDSKEVKTNAETIKLIMNKLDTPIAKSVLKETKSMYETHVMEKTFILACMLMFTWIVVALTNHGEISTVYSVVVLCIMIALMIFVAYVGLVIKPKV